MKQTNNQPTAQDGSEKPSRPQSERETLKQSFADDGYFVLRNVVSKQKLSALHNSIAAAFDKATQSGTLFSGGGLLSGHLNCFPGEEARFVYDALQERGIIAL